MRRRRVLALVSIGWGLAALGPFACTSGDVVSSSPEAGAPDATTTDSGPDDGGSNADADAGSDGSELDAPACVPFDAAVYTDAEVQAGLAIVLARKCEQCHGEQLQGNQNGVPSSNAEGGTAYPPDLTPDPTYGLGCWTNAQIERAFLYGIDKNGEPLCNPMPHFGDEGDAGIDEAGAAAVVAYLRNIPIVVSPYVPKTPACYPPPDAGEPDAGEDAGQDAGTDSGVDAAGDAGDGGDASVTDAAPDSSDSGSDDASDAALDAD
jgi:hypothetical protein